MSILALLFDHNSSFNVNVKHTISSQNSNVSTMKDNFLLQQNSVDLQTHYILAHASLR